ncbi:MAG: O-antigen ligase family protein [Solirubrobacteraceae bacterium]
MSPPGARARHVVAALLLAGPTVLAFFSGGFFDEARITAGLAVWALVAIVAVTVRSPLPRDTVARLAVAALLLLAAWTALSKQWAPLSTPAVAEAERMVLYAGALLAGVAAFADRSTLRAVEPALAAGAALVVVYGISERLLPGLLSFERSRAAGGRLDQPLTYWNAMGALAAIGMVLCVRVAGDARRGHVMAAAAGAAAVPLALGAYLSLSRGALAALAVGILLLLLLDPTRRQLRAAGALLAAGGLAVAVSVPLPGVSSLEGSPAAREKEGALMLAALVVLCATAALAAWLIARRAERDPAEIVTRSTPRRRALLAVALAAIVVAAPLVAATTESTKVSRSPGFGATADRLGSFRTNRYAYWRVAAREFADHPLWGGGAGSFRVAWFRNRDISESVDDAHSLYLQTAAELGLVGLALLLAAFAGVALAARAAHRRAPGAVEGLAAALAVYAVHAGLDWDWQMPALTLVAVLAAAALLGLRAAPTGSAGRSG